jgi:hypothetical protein
LHADSSVLALDVPSLDGNPNHSGAFLALSADLHESMYRSMQQDFPHREWAHLSYGQVPLSCKAAARLGMKEDRRGAKEFPVLFICRGAAKMMHASRLQVGRAAELRPRGHKVVNTLVRRDRSHRSLREKEHLDLVTSSLCSYLAPDGTSLEFAQFRKPSVLTRRQAAWVRRSRISRQTLSD